jgi:hypothetical protein
VQGYISGPIRSADYAQLDTVKVHRRLRFANQEETRVAEARGEVRGREEPVGGGVGDGVEDDAGVAAAAVGIADRQAVYLLLRLGGDGRETSRVAAASEWSFMTEASECAVCDD